MYLIIGLGNPGQKYTLTRHNVGFMVIDALAEREQLSFRSGRGNYVYAQAVFAGEKAILLKPLTYMNLSGEAFRHASHYWDIPEENCLVVCDDFNLPFGTLRLRPGGSAGGQKGLDSILKHAGTRDIPRLRIGIGGKFANASSFVLSEFNKAEKEKLPDLIAYAADAAVTFIGQGIHKAMTQFNRNFLEEQN